MKIRLSVIVCTFNRADLLDGALSSLSKQSLCPDLFEVVIVDNNSNDATADVARGFCRRHPHWQYRCETRQGLSFARNAGWRSARGAYVSFLDDDAVAEAEWCERILNAFADAGTRATSVGGPILPFYRQTPPRWFSDEMETRTWGEKKGFLEGHRARFGFSGSNMSFPKAVLERYGGFAEHLGMTGSRIRMGEESDLFYRVHATEPYFWYDPAIRVRHLVGARNMTLSFRLLRAYRSGQARAAIQRRSLFSRTYLAEGKVFLYLGKELVRTFLPPFRANSSQQVRALCALVQQGGFLLG